MGFVYGCFDARERTLEDTEFGGLRNEVTVREHTSCGYEALHD